MSTAKKSPFCTVCMRYRFVLSVVVKYHNWSSPEPVPRDTMIRESFLEVEARTLEGPISALVSVYLAERSMSAMVKGFAILFAQQESCSVALSRNSERKINETKFDMRHKARAHILMEGQSGSGFVHARLRLCCR